MQKWVGDLAHESYSPETIRGHYALLAAICRSAVSDGLIVRSPCVGIELPRIEHIERRYLTEAQVEALAEAHPERYRTLIHTAAYLGPRWQEAAGLRVSALDMRPGRRATVRIVTTIERSNGTYEVVEYGKSKAARRTLKVPAFLSEMLACHINRFSDGEFIFSAQRGGHLRYDNFRTRVWEPAVLAAGLSPLTFHELRHTAAAFMIDDGADPLQVKRRMGHEDIKTTYNLLRAPLPRSRG